MANCLDLNFKQSSNNSDKQLNLKIKKIFTDSLPDKIYGHDGSTIEVAQYQ